MMGPEGDAVTTQGAAAEIRHAAALLREAQAVRRRLEKLATSAPDLSPSSTRPLDEGGGTGLTEPASARAPPCRGRAKGAQSDGP